ncbi:MAG: Calx-beta domain-containing protein [Bacteroidota bacterium]
MKKVTFPSLLNILLTLFFGLAVNFASAQPGVYLSSWIGNSSVIEGDVFLFSVHLTSVNATDTVINITTVAYTSDSSDYTPLTTTVTIPAGELSYNVAPLAIPTGNDSAIEDNEYFYINGTVTSGNTINTTATSLVEIIDNDTVPTVFVYNSYTLTEPNSGNIYYYLSNPYSSDIVVNWATTTGTANAADFNTVNTTVTIPAGQSNGYINIATIDDAIVEADENFTFTGTVTSGNTTNLSAVCLITIRDNDVVPTFELGLNGMGAVTESQNLGFYCHLNRAYNSAVVFQIATANGTAGSSDYTAINTTFTIPAGSTQVFITIPVTEDSLDESIETFTVTATVTSGNTTNSVATSQVSIIDNDGLPDLVIHGGDELWQVEEGGNASFGIGLTHPSVTDTVVQITTSNGTAGSLDYTPVTITATIPEGQTSLYLSSFIVPTNLDQLQESSETFSINGTVTSGNTYNTTASLTYLILDNYNLNAQNDSVEAISHVATTFSLLTNDTLYGLPLVTSVVNVTLASNTLGVTVNSLGVLSIPDNLDDGDYELNYTICEVANPANCDTASILLTVKSPIVATYTPTYSDYNGDGYTSVGDIISFQFNITNSGNAPITNISPDYMYGITVSGGPIATLNPGQTDSTTFSTIHIITQDDINFGFFTDPSPISQGIEVSFDGTYYAATTTGWAEATSGVTLSISDGIRLKAFVDTNANGIQDVNEVNFPLGHFNYETDSSGIIHNLYTTPYYLYESNPATTYNLTYQVDSDYASNNSCTASYPVVTVSPGSGITNYNFPVTVTPYQDLLVNIHNYSAPPRPGFMYYSYITYTNNSNLTVPSGTLTFTKDPGITMVGVCDNSAVITSTGFTYNFNYLLPFETRTFWIQMGVANIPTVSLGQLLTNSVSITLLPGDILPLNNTSTLTETIVGSYDPNEKTESHGGRILQSSFTSNDYLTYTIKFENTGTANAINVKVSDILDDKLDEATLKMIDASHGYALERINKTLTWNFFGIDLPPSVDDTMIGHGHIVFQIKPKPGYVVGDIIPNSANIYFDFNPAIITDSCVTEFVQSLDAPNFAFNDFEYYPNPVKNSLIISNSSTIDTIEITSVLGQKIVTKKINDIHTEINLTDIAKGIYFVKVTSNSQEKIVKIVRE